MYLCASWKPAARLVAATLTISFFGIAISARAQQPAAAVSTTGQATVKGTVTDPTGAVIPGATVTLTPATGRPVIVTSQSDGTYTARGLAKGVYSETITMPGFASFVQMGVRLAAGQSLTLDAKLAIEEQTQQINVTTNGAHVSTDQDSNASATVISGKDLDALSDDPDELSAELTELAGPSAGPTGGQIYVDGFTGGQLPPKSSIREIRVNQNPFSAQYDKIGYGRVEVFTKPGSDKLHGSFQVNGNPSQFNTSNPFQGPIPQLPYYTIFALGNLTGPLSHKASYSLGGSYRDIQQNTIFDGTLLALSPTSTTPCPPGTVAAPTPCSLYNISIPTFYPQRREDFTPRLDYQLAEKNTLVARYQYENSLVQNDGTGGFELPETAFNLGQTENTIQITDTQTVTANIINETRFEYERDLSQQTPLNTTPTVTVQSNFTAGGSNTQVINDHQDHFEVQNYSSIQLKHNFVRFGGRLRTTRDAQYTNSGSNGNFNYSCLQRANCSPDANGVVSAYDVGQVAQYSITRINQGNVNATVADLGIYVEDDWKAKPNLTITGGLRYETQNYINDHLDLGPRISFAWGVGNKDNPKTVLRGGFGIFFDRFTLTNVITTKQINGTNQQQFVVSDPSPSCSPSNPAACGGNVAAGGLTTYTIAPGLRAPYLMQTAIGADQQLGSIGTVSVNYLYSRGEHEFNAENINTPLNGIYAVPGTNGSAPPNFNQFQSNGIFNQSQFSINPRINYGQHVTLFGYYVLSFANADTSGAGSYPSVPYNLRADYGRAGFDIRNRVFLGGRFALPHLITISPFMVASSGVPFNIYTGTDLNHDHILNNDRPSFATAATVNPIKTKYGTFDPNPAPGATPIPINYGRGPALFTMNLRLLKTIGFGGENAAAKAAHGPAGPAMGPGGRGPHGHGGPFGDTASSGRRYSLAFGVIAENIFNVADLSAPHGNLNSPLFGVSTQLAGRFYTTNSALRRISLQTSFNF